MHYYLLDLILNLSSHLLILISYSSDIYITIHVTLCRFYEGTISSFDPVDKKHKVTTQFSSPTCFFSVSDALTALPLVIVVLSLKSNLLL